MLNDKTQGRKCGVCGGHLLVIYRHPYGEDFDAWYCAQCGQVFALPKGCPERPGIPESETSCCEHLTAHRKAIQDEVNEYVGQGRG
ncbi:MAG: hypothetical protein UU76_C0007G0016 [Parcubacteria group bacterium GW2011_GWC1_41_7]|nr:MAG: hypothetical protein UU76_C0007G0016 [Parcubacteria group bacterium GW2011_GWC1_41_7]